MGLNLYRRHYRTEGKCVGGHRRAFNGLCAAIVQSAKQAGDVSIQATSPGLEPGPAVIHCEQVAPRPAVA